jgi:hypothetical protein
MMLTCFGDEENAVPLKRGRGEERLVYDAVHFPMEDVRTGKRVICEIGKYTLSQIFEDDDLPASSTFIERSYPGHMQVFLMFRDGIEALASDEYDRGQDPPCL